MDLTSSTPSLLLNGVGSTANKRRSNSYKFPILKQSDIIQCLKELVSGSGNDNSHTNNIVLTKEELEEPQHCKEKIRSVFTFLVRTKRLPPSCQPYKTFVCFCFCLYLDLL